VVRTHSFALPFGSSTGCGPILRSNPAIQPSDLHCFPLAENALQAPARTHAGVQADHMLLLCNFGHGFPLLSSPEPQTR
jgi:hypothetical protein